MPQEERSTARQRSGERSRRMEACTPYFVTALASAISAAVPDDKQLNLLALALTQLGDTLTLILAARAE